MSNSPLKLHNDVLNWEISSIGKILTLLKDGTHGTHERVEKGIPLLSAKDITKDGKISLDNKPSLVSDADYDSIHKIYEIKFGDILLTVVGTLGRCAIWVAEGKFTIQRSVAVLRADENVIDNFYLSNFLKSDWVQNQLQIRSNATAQAGVYLGELADIEVTYPKSIEQQQKIAKILSIVDNLIEKTQTLIDKYTAIKQGMMADLFTRGIDMTTGPHCGKLRPSVEDAPELYKQTELGWVPKEWEVVLLDDISMRGSGHTPSKSFPEYWNEGIKWVSLADSKKLDDLYIHETDNNISELGLQNSSATKHPKGTVILSRDAGIGKSAILAEEMAVSQHFMAWRCGSALDNYFLYFWLQSMKPNFNAIAMGSTIPTIGLGYFKKLKIAIPKDVNEQEAIGKRVLKVFEKNVELKAEKKKYELIKKGLMQDLLTGKVQVS
jgi:type I restriction enzyme S subunit